MEVLTPPIRKTSTCSDATFACPDLTTFCRLDELGLEVTGQRLEPDRAVLACRVVEPDRVVPPLRLRGHGRGTRVVRRLAHEPFGWRPTTLLVTVRRYRCTGCGQVWRQDTTAGGRAAGEAVPARRCGGRWRRWWCQHLTVARVAEGLAVAWNTANDAVLAEGRRVLIDDPHRFDGVTVIGVDEHVWRHTRRGDKYVTVIIDLTPIRDGTGPARLLDMVEGRSKQAFKTWLADRDAGLARRGRGRRDGRVHRVQDRHRRGAARRGRGDGPLPRRPPGRRRAGPVPPPGPAGPPRPPRPHRRPALPGPADPAHRRRPAHRQADATGSRPCSPSTSTSRSRPPGASTSG